MTSSVFMWVVIRCDLFDLPLFFLIVLFKREQTVDNTVVFRRILPVRYLIKQTV